MGSFHSGEITYSKNPNNLNVIKEEALMDPYFQYVCPDDATILDTQYSTNG